MFKPRINIGSVKAEQPTQLNCVRQIATSGMTVVDGLFGQAKQFGQGFWGKELFLHDVMFLESSHMTASSIGRVPIV